MKEMSLNFLAKPTNAVGGSFRLDLQSQSPNPRSGNLSQIPPGFWEGEEGRERGTGAALVGRA